MYKFSSYSLAVVSKAGKDNAKCDFLSLSWMLSIPRKRPQLEEVVARCNGLQNKQHILALKKTLGPKQISFPH
jgi:hypothetical protein